MNEEHDNRKGRRALLTGIGAAGLALGATAARAQRRPANFQPARHTVDAWMNELPGGHRVFIDTSSAHGGAEALLYANNLYNAQANAYSGGPQDFAMVVCYRHFSTPFGYNDTVWAKYGEGFFNLIQFADPATGQAPKINLLNSAAHTTLPNFGITIDSQVAKGTQFAICDTATHFIADQLAAGSGGSAEDIYADLVAGAIPNSRFVSAGVMAMTRAQEYGYSLLYAG